MIEGVADGRLTHAMLDELAAAVLDVEHVRLALEVREGGPLALRRGVELAALVLGDVAGDDARPASEPER